MNPTNDFWIGVLGGGQLGRMFALEARRMGFKVLKWTGGDISGAAYTADLVFEESFESPSALQRFIYRVNVATVEFENVPSELLEALEDQLPLMPGSRAVATCQNREREKSFLAANGIPCARFEIVESAAQLEGALAALSGDAVLKTAEFGYDGKGQACIAKDATPAELCNTWTGYEGRAVLEERIDLAAELSVIVARGQDQSVVTYDPAENQHRGGILDLSIVPARLPEDILTKARETAIAAAEALDYVGVLGVEFFLSTDGRLLVNELAPRPHNSGHHTLDACETSQFEQQLRVVSELPLGSPRLTQPAVMWNLLGDLWLDEITPPDWTPVLATPGAALHLYGKTRARPGRKMGHVTFRGATQEEVIARASNCMRSYGREITL